MTDKKIEDLDLSRITQTDDEIMNKKLRRKSVFTRVVAFLIQRLLEDQDSPIDSGEIAKTSRIDTNNVSKTLNELWKREFLKHDILSGNLVTYHPVIDEKTKLPKIFQFYKQIKKILEI